MKRLIPIVFLIAGVILFVFAFMFYQKSESLKRETDSLRSLATLPDSSVENNPVYEPKPEPEYDPSDITQTPPGVTPFVFGSICAFNWGEQVRQYCEAGDNATLDIVEGTTQTEEMADLIMCLNEMIQRIDVYNDPNLRYIDSEEPLDETNRKALACDMTQRYGDSPVFAEGSIGYMIKEHVESGNISRLENR